MRPERPPVRLADWLQWVGVSAPPRNRSIRQDLATLMKACSADLAMKHRRILFFAEAATLAHVARPTVLANNLEGLGHEPVMACDDRYRCFIHGRSALANLASAQHQVLVGFLTPPSRTRIKVVGRRHRQTALKSRMTQLVINAAAMGVGRLQNAKGTRRCPWRDQRSVRGDQVCLRRRPTKPVNPNAKPTSAREPGSGTVEKLWLASACA